MVERHNESRDLNLDLLSLTGLTQTVRELLIKEPDSTGENALRVDWGMRGFGSSKEKRCLIFAF